MSEQDDHRMQGEEESGPPETLYQKTIGTVILSAILAVGGIVYDNRVDGARGDEINIAQGIAIARIQDDLRGMQAGNFDRNDADQLQKYYAQRFSSIERELSNCP